MSRAAGIGAPRIDEANECIWWGDRRVALTPKVFLVLRRLLQQPNQIVTKSALLDAAWPDTHVADGVLTLAINQLREAFGDDARQPRFIETVHRRGYRWIGAAAASEDDSPLLTSPTPAPSLVVGREAALAQLEQALARAVGAARQIVFVTGEPGIGKTTLLDAFVARLAAGAIPCARDARRFVFASGQCVDGFGTTEAYLPLLEGLERLCRESTSDDTVALLRRLAPTWLLQLPRLLKPGEQDELRVLLAGSTGERMLRELLSFIEELATDRTFVLLLEDLHWSDHATVGALAALATRREPARLLVMASYRPVDAVAQLHPVTKLKHELRAKGQCIDITLGGLESDAVAAYVTGRFPNHRLPPELAAELQVHTAGNPLFLRNALEEFVQRGWLEERDGAWECTVDLAALVAAVPESTREMIAFRLQQLPASDLHLLEAASVIGPSFATQALAAVVERHPAEVEVDCARLARAFLGEGQSATWPDGSAGIQHAFAHALYQHVLYGGVTPARRELLHRRAAECLEKGYGEEAITIASQLALHFERGGDLERAVGHHRKAARQAMERYAYDQAIEHLQSALASMSRLPAGAERDSQELAICTRLLMFARYGTSSTERLPVIDRIQSLSTRGKTTPELLEALAVLAGHHTLWGDLRAARSAAAQAVERAEAVPWGGVMAKVARARLGYCQIVQGEIQAGVANLEGSMDVPAMTPAPPYDPGIMATSDAGFGHCLLGNPSHGRGLGRLALDRGDAAQHPPTMAHAALGGLRIGMTLGDDELVEECVARMTSLPQPLRELWEGWAQIASGWLESNHGDLGGVDRILRGEQSLRVGTIAYQRVYTLLITATVLIRCGRHDEADVLLTDALALGHEAGGCWSHAELHRLRAEIFLAGRAQSRRATRKWEQLGSDAEGCLRRGLEVARSQGAKWWELRIAVSLARLLSEGDRAAEGSDLLRSVYDEFKEGFELPDLRAARAMLQSS